MADYSQQIKELEEQITKTKYNKKTEFAIGKYKAKLAQLKIKQEDRLGDTAKIWQYLRDHKELFLFS